MALTGKIRWIETVRVIRRMQGLCMCIGWSILKHKLFYELVVVIFQWWFKMWNWIVSLVNSFGEFYISPFKEIGAALERRFKDGRCVKLLVLRSLHTESEILIWNFCTYFFKIITTSPCVNHIYTLPLKLSFIIKKNWIRFDFLCFHIRSKHFDRKGRWIWKNPWKNA